MNRRVGAAIAHPEVCDGTLARAGLFGADGIAVVHVVNRVVRRCSVMGDAPVSGKNFDHRIQWTEVDLKNQPAPRATTWWGCRSS